MFIGSYSIRISVFNFEKNVLFAANQTIVSTNVLQTKLFVLLKNTVVLKNICVITVCIVVSRLRTIYVNMLDFPEY